MDFTISENRKILIGNINNKITSNPSDNRRLFLNIILDKALCDIDKLMLLKDMHNNGLTNYGIVQIAYSFIVTIRDMLRDKDYIKFAKFIKNSENGRTLLDHYFHVLCESYGFNYGRLIKYLDSFSLENLYYDSEGLDYEHQIKNYVIKYFYNNLTEEYLKEKIILHRLGHPHSYSKIVNLDSLVKKWLDINQFENYDINKQVLKINNNLT